MEVASFLLERFTTHPLPQSLQDVPGLLSLLDPELFSWMC